MSCFQRMKKRSNKIKKLHRLCPCYMIYFPHPSQEQLIERSDTLLCFFFVFLTCLVPSSSSVFTDVSVDHWLHLVEGAPAARVIQLGVYHRALYRPRGVGAPGALQIDLHLLSGLGSLRAHAFQGRASFVFVAAVHHPHDDAGGHSDEDEQKQRSTNCSHYNRHVVLRERLFQNDPELGARRSSRHVRRVFHVAEESPVVSELSRTQL